MRRRRNPPKRNKPVLLETLSKGRIARGDAFGRATSRFYFDVYSDWVRQLAQNRNEILRELVSASTGPFQFNRWQRIVQYRYSSSPLSCVGSVLLQAGGRFNFGGFDPLSFPPFPALYLAEDRETAWTERYGRSRPTSGLTSDEIVLAQRESVTYLSVSGTVDRVVDLGDPERLQGFVNILATFKIPRELEARARRLGFPPHRYPAAVDALASDLLQGELAVHADLLRHTGQLPDIRETRCRGGYHWRGLSINADR